MSKQLKEFKQRMGWSSLTGQTRKLVILDLQEYGLDGAVRVWKNQHIHMPYGIERLIESTDSLTSTGPLGVQGVGWNQ